MVLSGVVVGGGRGGVWVVVVVCERFAAVAVAEIFLEGVEGGIRICGVAVQSFGSLW